MLKKLFVACIVLCLCGSAVASDFATWFLGSDRDAAVRAEWKASPRMSLFVEGNWDKSLAKNTDGVIGGDLGVLWYVNPDSNIPVSGWVDFLPAWSTNWLPKSIPISFYVGADGGYNQDSNLSTKLLGGFLVNPKDRVNLGFEMSYDFTQDSWRNGVSMPTNDKLVGMVSLRVNF
jgi:hypothetical protein